jgi:hypothetical protein
VQNVDDGGTLMQAAPQGTSGLDFLSGDVMTQLWDDDGGVATMAAKKKKAPAKKKPAKKSPGKKKPKPRPTRNRPGCDTTGPACITNPR